jgi:hypothetical protein
MLNITDSIKEYMYKNKENILPISTANNNVKCLDFNIDKVVFKSGARLPISIKEIKEIKHSDKKSLLEVMDMV